MIASSVAVRPGDGVLWAVAVGVVGFHRKLTAQGDRAMAQFKAFEPGVEVMGELVLQFVEVMGAFKSLAEGILRDHGIVDPKPGEWYLQQAWLDSFKTIAEQIGPNTVFLLARQIPTSADIGVEIDTLEKALFHLDPAYRSTHRNGEAGHYIFVKTGERAGQMHTLNPYPCDFDRGILDALTKRFEPANPYLDVVHDDLAPCKKQGADSCTYSITW